MEFHRTICPGEPFLEGIDEQGCWWRQRQERAGGEDRHDGLLGLHAFGNPLRFDASPLALRDFEPTFALKFTQGGTHGVPTDLQLNTQLPLTGQMRLPAPGTDGFPQAPDCLRHQRYPLGQRR